MTPTQIVITVIVVLAVLAAAAVAWLLLRRQALRNRFGPEYDRLVAERDSRTAAEHELRDRQRRVAELDRKPIAPETRARYAAEFEEIQVKFIDAPGDAVAAADRLVSRIAAERGYPTDNYEEQLSYLSVEHGRTLDHYRNAHDVYRQNERGEADTEQLREALVHYRTMIADLLGREAAPRRSEPARGLAFRRSEPASGRSEPASRTDRATSR
jgi:hypothetical protein